MHKNMTEIFEISSNSGCVSIILCFLYILHVLKIHMLVVKCRHSISVKCSRYRDTGVTDLALNGTCLTVLQLHLEEFFFLSIY